MPFDATHLRALELSDCDLINLTEEEQFAKIKKKWRRLCLKYHPDKHRGSVDIEGITNKFVQVNEAYRALTIKTSDYVPDINAYFTQQAYIIPKTTFSLLQQEGIEARYAELLKQFSELVTTEQKQAFAQHYASFLNLAQSLERITPKLNEYRSEWLYQQQQETLYQGLIREWRILILRLFGKEYLDDFEYRETLARGSFNSVLAEYKLYSPIKIMTAIINTVILIICVSAKYIATLILQDLLSDFMAQRHYAEQINYEKMILLALKMFAIIALPALALYYAPAMVMLMFSLSTIANFLESIASPVNRLIRPLAQYLTCSPVTLSLLSLAMGITGLCGVMIYTTMFTNCLMIIPWISMALDVFSLYQLGKFFIALYAISPDLCFFNGLLVLCSFLLGLMLPVDLNPDEPLNDLLLFLMTLNNSSMLYEANSFIENMTEAIGKQTEVLPLPSEPVSDTIIEATRVGYKNAALSALFFNTPKDADAIERNQRTTKQFLSELFGDGQVTESEEKWRNQEPAGRSFFSLIG